MADDDGTKRMHPELKSCNDAKVSAAAADAPEEFRVGRCACPNDASSRGHDFRAQQAVDGKAVSPAGASHASTPGSDLPHLYARSRLPVPRNLQELSRDRDRQGVPRRLPRSCAYLDRWRSRLAPTDREQVPHRRLRIPEDWPPPRTASRARDARSCVHGLLDVIHTLRADDRRRPPIGDTIPYFAIAIIILMVRRDDRAAVPQ
ncbi:hypothetical protein PMI09_00842 [Rhizobium sp. CF122]|nr:hypothetical protein PMI09_00842 [Rhizobium sp. CF122]